MNDKVVPEILIWILVCGIVCVQVYIFMLIMKKIDQFKNIFPVAKRFYTVKVYIPEDSIANIEVAEVMDNLKRYSRTPESQHDLEEVDSIVVNN